MSLEIAPELEEMVQTAFQKGQYESESEMIRQALGLLRKRDQLREHIPDCIAEIDRGEGIDEAEVFQELEEKVAQLPKANQ